MQDYHEKLEFAKTLLVWAGILFGLMCFVAAVRGSING